MLTFFDTETTGSSEDSKIIQFAGMKGGEIINFTFNPEKPIEIEAMATHHITDKMVKDKPKFSEKIEEINKFFENSIPVAHNAEFDKGRVEFEGVNFPKYFICTLKVARNLYHEQQNFGLQYLRYWFGIEVEAQAHDALGDILVLKEVFLKLKKELSQRLPEKNEKEIITLMADWSRKPVLLHKVNFGQHKGKLFSEIEKDYLIWCLGNWKDLNGDLLYTIEHYAGIKRGDILG